MRPIKPVQLSDALPDKSPEAVDNDWASPGHVHARLLMAATGIGRFKSKPTR